MIGIFDSGLGGLTVARAIMQALPDQKIIYLGDTARGPYGNRPAQEVIEFAIENTEFLLKKKVQTVVVGCNTASAVAGQRLRKEFPDAPIFEVISPAAREALRLTRDGRIGVIGTRTTIQSGAYQKWIKKCVGRACPLFVPLVEAGKIIHPATYEIAQQYLKPLRNAGIDTLILGCTHYPFLKPIIADIMGKGVRLVDSAQTVAKDVADKFHICATPCFERENTRCRTTSSTRTPKHEFYVSKKTPRFQELAEKWLGTEIKLKLVKI